MSVGGGNVRVGDAGAESLRILREEWRSHRDNPVAFANSGQFRCKSTWAVGPDGRIMDSTRAGAVIHEGIAPFIPHEPQRRVYDAFALCRRQNVQTKLLVLKSRGCGGSIGATAIDIGLGTSQSNYSSLCLVQDEAQIAKMIQYRRDALQNLPVYAQMTTIHNDSKSQIRADFANVGVRNSEWAAAEASPAGIRGIRGGRIHFLHGTELSRAPHAAEISASLTALPYKPPDHERWRQIILLETTANGQDPFFFPQFDFAWKEQGSCNYWEAREKRHVFMAGDAGEAPPPGLFQGEEWRWMMDNIELMRAEKERLGLLDSDAGRLLLERLGFTNVLPPCP